MEEKSMYGPVLLRLTLGIMFIITGIGKLLNPAGITGMLSSLTLFAWAPAFWAWVLLLSELVFGVSVLLGWKTKYTVWPLVIVLAVAAIFVALPNMNGNPITLLFHLIGISGLISIHLTGPGALAVSKK